MNVFNILVYNVEENQKIVIGRIINMNKIKEPERYNKAIELWGEDLQFGMLSEECGELLTAINHWRRKRIHTASVVEEMADVIIMIYQVMVAMGLKIDNKMLDDWIETKLNKMERQIELYEK